MKNTFNGVRLDDNGRLIPTAYDKVETFEWYAQPPLYYIYVSPNGSDDNPGTCEEPLKSVQTAIERAEPGTAVRLKPGLYDYESIFINNLNGTDKNPVWIGGVPDMERPVLVNPSPLTIAGGSYVILHDIEVTRLSEPDKGGNPDSYEHGIHVSDGGKLDTTHHFVFRNLYVHNIWNSPFKLSGLDYGYLFDCEVADDPLYGRNSGSVDHVRSNNMTIAYNYLHGTTTNGFSFKGGSRDCVIHNNLIVNAHVGAHMGQSTGVQFFRPELTDKNVYEAQNIRTYSNIMIDVLSPFVISSAKDCYAVNNTIITRNPYDPSQARLFRILNQGATDENNNPLTANDGVPHYNTIANNLFYYGGSMAGEITNVGANIPLDTFTIKNNMYYNWSDPDSMPDENKTYPTSATFRDFPYENLITGKNPLFEDADNNNFGLRAESPAINAGADYDFVKEDFFDKPFMQNRSIGAIESGYSRRV